MKLRQELLIILTNIFTMNNCRCCRNVDLRYSMSYNLVKFDAKSTASVMTRRRFVNVSKCKDYAEAKQALAFNFGNFLQTFVLILRAIADYYVCNRISKLRLTGNDFWEPNCILLHCPELNGLHQLVNISGVDYYSTYSNETYGGNVSLNCIANIGLFIVFTEKQNFTNAQNSCHKVQGVLADVTSDARTRGLISLIGDNLVFIGLSNKGNSRNWKNEFGNALSCFDYRAWDSGEPSHSRGCVGLAQITRKRNPVWKVIPCNAELPFICEIPHSQHKTKRLTHMK
ncbi:PREDICTED: uncharacterized protein LOC105366481 [Ceratosolen solmsi marchali]|uniref:Uncharacterized protein LOC105366481 n=1 Tax=Ceratosolen solmsi marchali TaxID=326594 RepID=A0AAJ6YS93_9HYME|nr:PREDICTED: uncharacterized protein LOC105366481 [Ceratosolen solmsi marchali]